MEKNEELILRIRNEEKLAELIHFLKITSGKLSMPLFLVFWFADLLYAPERKWEFLGLRLLMIPVCLITNNLISKSGLTLNQGQIIGTVYTFFNAFIIHYMIYITDGIVSPYYAGLNLVFMGIISFVPWTLNFLFINSLIIYLPFFGLIAFTINGDNYAPVIINSFFVVGTLIIALVVRHFTELLRQQDALSKYKLEMEVAHRGEIIDRQTKEAIKLRELANQFSPQVVHAIQKGELDIYKSIEESHICAVFFDIVNSTSKVVSIDKDKLGRVISKFIEDTMSILLKYDITVDKFLGDGILAFSNAPLMQQNPVDRVLYASKEILKKIQSDRTFYIENWGEELELKVGVAYGMANVGFYGQEVTIKSYTAIGKVINLACRLSDKASSSEILVSESVVKNLTSDEFTFKEVGEVNLKGFESEAPIVYKVASFAKEGANEGMQVCPNGHGIMQLDVNAEQIYVFVCRDCGYSVV